jgi:hypothetical protein
MRLRRLTRGNDVRNVLCALRGSQPEFISGLHVEPKLGCSSEVAPKPKGGIGGDAALAVDDARNAVCRNQHRFCKTIRAESRRLHELFKEHLAGVNRSHLVSLVHGFSRSVVVDNFNILWTSSAPAEAEAPLVIDTYGVLAGAVALQAFKPVARWKSKVFRTLGGIEKQKLPLRRCTNARKALHGVPAKEAFGVFAAKGLNHSISVALVRSTSSVQAAP